MQPKIQFGAFLLISKYHIIIYAIVLHIIFIYFCIYAYK